MGARHFDLLWRNVNGGNLRAGLTREMNCETAPARADLGDGHVRLKLQLAGGVDQLVQLRLFQGILLGIEKISARILHLIVQKQAIEIGREVVVMASMRGSKTDRVSLMPAPQGAPQPPHYLLRTV